MRRRVLAVASIFRPGLLSRDLPATHTVFITFSAPGGSTPSESNGTISAAMRIVSNVPVSVTLSHDTASTLDWKVAPCLPLLP